MTVLSPAEPTFLELNSGQRDEAFAEMRARGGPVHFPGPDLSQFGAEESPDYYAIVRHADIAEVSRTPKIFSSAKGIASLLDPPPEFNEYFGSMIVMDDPRHARLRRIVSRAFTPRMIAALYDQVERAAIEIIEEFRPRGGGDFVAEAASLLPMRVICDMMGIPAEQHARVLELSNIIIGSSDPEFSSGEDFQSLFMASLASSQELERMVTALATEREDRPTGDLTSVLVHGNVEGERLTHQELASFFILLVVAGNETTRNAIAHGLKFLTLNPDQRALWTSDFERHAPTAVEEILRCASPVNYMRRTLARDHEMGGVRMREGDRVLMYYYSANRDENVFKDPHTFDVTRDPNPHLAFGAAGPHFCLGAHLARQEITVMFRELFNRLPDIRSTAPPERLYSGFINGIKHLECEF